MTTVGATATEALITNMYETLYNESAADLYDMKKQIDANTREKQQVRELMNQLEKTKLAVQNAKKNDPTAGAAIDALQALEKGVQKGLPNTDAARAAELDNASKDVFKDTNGNGVRDSFTVSSDDAKSKWKEYFAPLESALKAESDRLGDISSMNQVDLNRLTAIMRRAEQAISDDVTNQQKTKSELARNLKG